LHVVMRGKIIVEGEDPPPVIESSIIPVCRWSSYRIVIIWASLIVIRYPLIVGKGVGRGCVNR
jgi:hypothetical protein